jgi:rhodanese-related sulfurtransferase
MKQLAARELAALCAGAAAGPSPLLLDVREAWEFELAAVRVDGASTLHMPMNEVPARLDEIEAARTNGAALGDGAARPVVCICHHGMRSAQVVAFLERQGLTPIYNLAGGTEAWSTEVDPSVPRY